MAIKKRKLPVTLATMASICLISGLLVLAGGDPNHGKIGETYISNK